MGFAASSCSFTRFRILDAPPDEVLANLTDRLRQHAFQDIDDIPEVRSFGWVSYDDMLDAEWRFAPPQKGQYAVFSLRLDTRRIPPGVIKKHVLLAFKEERRKLAETGQKFIARDRQKEIKEQVQLKLLQRFLPVPGEFNVVWNLAGNEVWFASIQGKMIELFMDVFLNTFGLHLEQLTPYALAATMLDESQMLKVDALEPTVFANSTRSESF